MLSQAREMFSQARAHISAQHEHAHVGAGLQGLHDSRECLLVRQFLILSVSRASVKDAKRNKHALCTKQALAEVNQSAEIGHDRK